MPVHRYSLALKDPGAHLLEVRLTVERPEPGGQRFAIPAWIPGSYLIRDYARNVVSIRAEADGVAVPIVKTDKSSWRAGATSRPLTVVLEVYAYEPGVRGAHFDRTHAYFNGACVFLLVVGQGDLPCELEILAPDARERWAKGFRVATSMRRAGAAPYGFGGYGAADYAELIDHPVEIGDLHIGEFEAAGIPHAIAIRGRTRCDMGRLTRDLKILCEQHIALLGPPADLDRYLFLLHAPGAGYGGLEHAWSSSLVCARDNLPHKGQGEVDDNYGTLLGLVSHEYFHLWNVKRMRPAVFAESDLAGEAYTELLWVFEGITSYYDDLQLLRSGLIDQARYLKLVGRILTRVERGAGRRRQSVAASSFDAWIKFYKPDANAGNAVVSYYAKGALIALCLDLKLRLETAGRTSLDDVMRACWARFGETGRSMSEDAFEALCAEVSGLDLGDFFDASVRGTGELPVDTLLASHGIDVFRRPALGRDDKGGDPGPKDRATGAPPPPTLGATLADRDGRSVFVAIDSGSPAERAGVAPGDVAVALDGLALTAGNLAQRLRACRAGERLALAVFRGDELLVLDIVPAAPAADTCWLSPAPGADAGQAARRDAWLGR
ncbi:MAG TPA: PDZ domain-containing protein [Woeseiaceae bacterium]|nr:PDZ domain-containing protein [Woeseiaceae bacterium]